MILVSVLLLWGHTMNKATHERNHLIGGLLAVSEVEALTIMVGSMHAGMALGSNWELISRTTGRSQGARLSQVKAFESSKHIPSDSPPTTSLLILPKQSINWKQNIYEPMQAFSFKLPCYWIIPWFSKCPNSLILRSPLSRFIILRWLIKTFDSSQMPSLFIQRFCSNIKSIVHFYLKTKQIMTGWS